MSPKWKQKWKRRRPDASYSLVPGALEEHPGLSRPAFQMSSPGTARLDPRYHSLQGFSLLTASLYSSSLALQKKKNTTKKIKPVACQIKFSFRCCFGVALVRLSVCRAEVTEADSYLRGCWRATGGVRLLSFSSGSISSPRLDSTMWLKIASNTRDGTLTSCYRTSK